MIDSAALDFCYDPLGKIELARTVVEELKTLNPEKFRNLNYLVPES